MNTYKFNTRISEKGIIKLPFEPNLFNKEVELIIHPVKYKNEEVEKENYTAMDFVKEYAGIISGMEHITDEEVDNLKYTYLKEKYGL